MPENVSPLLQFAYAGFAAIALTTLLVGLWGWGYVLKQWRRGEEPLAHEPRRWAPWGVLDLVIAIVLYVAFMLGSVQAAREVFGMQIAADGQQLSLFVLLADSAAKLAAVVLTGAIIAVRTGASLADLGLSLRHLPSDLRLGALAFATLAIPTYGLQFVLTKFMPSRHPLIEALEQEHGPLFLLIALFAAVISAPIVEEFFFRVLLQGWVEKLCDTYAAMRPGFLQSLLIGGFLQEKVPPGEQISVEATPWDAPTDSPHNDNPYVPPSHAAAAQELKQVEPVLLAEAADASRLSVDCVAIGLSSLVFALMHYSHGPDWIALTFLAIGLGYLYRRTHRITPSLVVHLLLNSVSMLGLTIQIYSK